MRKDLLLSLILKRLNGQLSTEETLELDNWANKDHAYRLWLDRVSGEETLEKEVQQWRSIDPAKGHAKWVAYLQGRRRSRIRQITGWSVAASLLIAMTIIGLTRKAAHNKVPDSAIAVAAPTVLPGRNTATLTLGNGKELLLDSLEMGELGVQGSSKVVKADNGSLAYRRGKGKEEAVVYNTLRTPRSGQYKVELPDGTRVWLNNETSLKYPTSFRGRERMVELSGEAYFEVASRADQPFIVKVRDEDVQVLGTSFNVMSYSEEGGTQTTLLTGAVAVKTGKGQVKLKPDEQAQVKEDGGITVTKDVASQDIVSWKDGFFYFGRSSFATEMRQLARWYDVDVVYGGKVPEMEFAGKCDRSLPLNTLLEYWNKNQIHFRLEGRKLIVSSN